jgi:hypothetical protein
MPNNDQLAAWNRKRNHMTGAENEKKRKSTNIIGAKMVLTAIRAYNNNLYSKNSYAYYL